MVVYLGKATPASGQGGGGSITVDQTYDATSPNAQSGTAVAEALATITAFTGATSSVAGSAGLVPAPTTSDVDKYLKGDGTWGTVSGGIQNTATGTNSLTILGNIATIDEAINIGNDSKVLSKRDIAIGYKCVVNGQQEESVAIGYNITSSGASSVTIGSSNYNSGSGTVCIGKGAQTTGLYSMAFGKGNQSTADGAIQLGGYAKTNNEAQTLYVGFYKYNVIDANYKLLDGMTGKIPNDRINVDANPTQNSTNFVTSGTIYNVLGNINTLLSQI